MIYEEQYQSYLQQVQATLQHCSSQVFPECSEVAQAAKYSLFSGGKRVRAVLCMAVSDLLKGDLQAAEIFAAAIEMLHCYSLIHDDLPCMDDDEMRRGKPACHKQFNEATALLAGDALLTASFEQIAQAPVSAQQRIQAVQQLAQAAGVQGMIYGQELDLRYENTEVTAQQLYEIHKNKTGKLIAAAVQLGALTAQESKEKYEALQKYAQGIGLVFQMVDDVLDVTSTTKELGKPIGSDEQNGKSTFVRVYGLQATQQMIHQTNEQACKALECFGQEAWFLQQLAQNLCRRRT